MADEQRPTSGPGGGTARPSYLLAWSDEDAASREFALPATPITIGRDEACDLTLPDPAVSRSHLRLHVADGQVGIADLGTRNGTEVNGVPVSTATIEVGDTVRIGNTGLRLVDADQEQLGGSGQVPARQTIAGVPGAAVEPTHDPSVLQVTVSGGGPVGLTFALLLDRLLGDRVAITVYDRRWTLEGSRIVWMGAGQGNARRRQVVTIQSRQYMQYPSDIRERLFEPGSYSQMWPVGPDSVDDLPPRNIRVARVEDVLLEVANDRRNIRLIPTRFNAEERRYELERRHVLAICEGSASPTREYFIDRFGAPDASMYSLHGQQLHDIVLGLQVSSRLPDPMSVLLTISQNRFLLNSLGGEGFLNMRLTDQEAEEVKGIDLQDDEFRPCIQSQPCLMEGGGTTFQCHKHGSVFLPALLRDSPLWTRVLDGLQLFGVAEQDLRAVTAFRLEMVQRPRFTAQLWPASDATNGTFGFLLGDAANAIHFWPGRGLNSGIPSAVSLARCLRDRWRGRALRAADLVHHEGAMAMIQYRQKSRAWEAMIDTDETDGSVTAIKETIARSIADGEADRVDPADDLEVMLARLGTLRQRLASRLEGLPDDRTLRDHLERLDPSTIHTLVASGLWNTARGGGPEVDIGLLHPEPERTSEPSTTPAPVGPGPSSAPPAAPVRPDDRAGSSASRETRRFRV